MRNEDVYLPDDDTFLLLRFLSSISASEFSCEIGAGTGVVTAELAKVSHRVLATDISPKACKMMWERVRKVPNVDVVCCDSLSAIREEEMFSLVVANPPYLPFEDESPLWSGGKGGIEVAQKFTSDALKRLRRGGRVAIVLSSLSNIKGYLRKYVKARIAARSKVGLFEELYVIEIKK